MSETPKSGMFGLTAMLNWVKIGLGCRYVLAFLLAALILGTWSDNAQGQGFRVWLGSHETSTVLTWDLEGPDMDRVFGLDLDYIRDYLPSLLKWIGDNALSQMDFITQLMDGTLDFEDAEFNFSPGSTAIFINNNLIRSMMFDEINGRLPNPVLPSNERLVTTINIAGGGVTVADMQVGSFAGLTGPQSTPLGPLAISGGNWIFNGNITGSGRLLIDLSAVTLNGNTRFADGARVSSGTLTLIGGNHTFDVTLEQALGSSVGGSLQIGDGGTTGRLIGNISVTRGNGNVTFNHNDIDVTFGGDITESGTGIASVTKIGNNTLSLLGNNIYSGLTDIQEGTLLFGTGTNDIGAITVGSNTVHAVLGGTSNVNTRITANGIVTNYGDIFHLAELTTSGSVVNWESGRIWNVTTLTTAGNVTNSGSMWNVATWTTGSAATAANVTNNATGIIYAVGTMTIHGALNNSGAISDVHTLNARNVFNSGGYIGNITTWTTGDVNTTGNVTNNSTGIIDTVGTMTIHGTLTNSGAISDVDTFIVRNVINNGEIRHSGLLGSSMQIENDLTNSGSMVNFGSMLVGNDLTNSGYMENIGSVWFPMQIDNDLINSGYLVNVPVIIVGNSITNTRSGFLVNVHSILSDYFQNQGTIAGTRDITMGLVQVGFDENLVPIFEKGTFINQGGTIFAGNVLVDIAQEIFELDQVSTLNIDGNFTNNYGNFVIGIEGDRNSAINVFGDAVVNGGMVSVEIIGGDTNYVVDKRYTFLTVNPDGDPDNTNELLVTSPLTLDVRGFRDGLVKVVLGTDYEQSYWLSFVRAFNFSQEGKTMNQRTMGRYLDQVGIYPGGDYLTVLAALDSARGGLQKINKDKQENGEDVKPPSIDPLHAAFDQLSGSIYGTMTTASFQNVVMFHNTLANVLRRDYDSLPGMENNSNRQYRGQAPPYASPDNNKSGSNPSTHIWGMVYGHAGVMHADGNVGKYGQGFSGILIGYDRFNSKPQRYGLFLSAGGGSLSGELGDRTFTTEFMVGPYLRQDTANTYMLLQAGIGNHHYDTKRRIVFGDPADPALFIDRMARNEHDAFVSTAHLEAGLRYRGGTFNLSPFVGVQATGLLRGAFTEEGNAGCVGLRAGGKTYSSFRAMFGMRFDSKSFRFFKGQASFYGNAAWMYEFEQSDRHTEFTARFVNQPGVRERAFTVHGNDPGRDWIQTGFGMNYAVTSFFRYFAGYDAYANSNQVMHSANLGFVYQR